MYASASKKAKSAILAQLEAEVGWSRANARRQLTAALVRRGPVRAVRRKPRPRTYGYDTLKVLQRVWEVTGRPSGKYLAVVMPATLANMDAHTGTGAFGDTAARYTPEVHAQLLTVSAATIDRLLAPYKRALQPGGKSTTRSRKNRHAERIPIMTHVAAIDWQPGRRWHRHLRGCAQYPRDRGRAGLLRRGHDEPRHHENQHSLSCLIALETGTMVSWSSKCCISTIARTGNRRASVYGKH